MGQRLEYFRQESSLKSPPIKILCVGEQQVGKSSFLSYHVQNRSQNHIKDSSCEVFLKKYQNSLNKMVWVEFYQLSNTYPEYLGCYMLQKYEAIIFFYDMTDKKSRNRLNLWLRLIQEHKQQQLWQLPVLLVGLKKNLLFQDETQQIIKDVTYQFHKIFEQKCFLYFGQQTSQQQKNYQQFQLFVKRVISKVEKDSPTWSAYKLLKSYKTFNYMYTYFQMTKKSTEEVIEKIKSTIQAMNIPGIIQKASQMYVKFTDKLSDY